MSLCKEEKVAVATSPEVIKCPDLCLASVDASDKLTNTTTVWFDYGLGWSDPFLVRGAGTTLRLLHGSSIANAIELDQQWFEQRPARKIYLRSPYDFEFNLRQLPHSEAAWTVIVADIDHGRHLRVLTNEICTDIKKDGIQEVEAPSENSGVDAQLLKFFERVASAGAIAAFRYERASA